MALILFLYGLLLVLNVAQSAQPGFQINYIHTHLAFLLPGDRTDMAGVLYFSGIGAVVSLLLAVGLWFRMDPARWGLALIAGIPIGKGLLQVAAIIGPDSGKLSKAVGDAFWFQLIGYGMLLAYLFRPDIQMAFARHDRFSAEFDPKKQEYDYDREQ